jgi:hypothetical protein
MSEAHWVGESSVHGDRDIEWCIICDKEAELMDCEKCGEVCCYYCSEGTDTGEPISCRHCLENAEECCEVECIGCGNCACCPQQQETTEER